MDPMQGQSDKQQKSVPYGSACSNCSQAKCRCILQSSGICERCHRLKKECLPTPNARKRKPRSSSSTTKRARIEEKLDDLVSLLQSQNAAKALTDLGGSVRTSVSSPASQSQPRVSESLQGDGELGCPASGFSPASLPSGTIPRPEAQGLRGPTLPPLANALYDTPELLTDATDVGGVSYAEAEAILHAFRTKRLRHFPILYIPPEMDAQTLQRDRPFLWLCIRAVCSRSVNEQNVLADKVRQIIAKKVIVDCGRDLDLLQGMLVFLGWCAYFSYGKPFLCTLCSMVISIAFDLRITRCERDDNLVHSNMNCFAAYTYRNASKGLNIPPPSNETRRALLACFIICTNICSFMKFDVIQWSPPLSDCMAKLAESHETPADEILIALAKIARVSEDVARNCKGPDDQERAPSSPSMFVRAFLNALEQVKQGLSYGVLQHDVVMTNIQSTTILIYELATYHQPPSVYSGFEYKRIEYLHLCLQVTKAYLERFHKFDPADITVCCSSVMFHFACAMKVLYRLLLLDDPGWDRVAARKEVDIVHHLELVVEKFEQAHLAAGIDNRDSEGDIFKRGAAALRLTVPVWRAALDQITGRDAGCGDTTLGDGGNGGHTGGVGGSWNRHHPADTVFMESMEDNWLSEMFLTWEGS